MQNPFAPPETAPPIPTTTQFIPDDELTVEYQLNEDDYITWYLYWYGQSSTIRRSRTRSHMSLVVIVVLIAIFLMSTRPDPAIIVFIIAGAVFVIAALLFSAFRMPKRQLTRLYRSVLAEGKNRSKFLPTRITIRPESVHLKCDLLDTRMSWRCVEKFIEADLYLYILITGTDAWIIPKAAFPTHEYLRRFVTAARSFHQAAAEA